MCEPATIAVVSSSVSMIAQGYAAKQQGEYAGKVGEYNARVQENEAVQTRNVGVEAENIQRQRTAQLISQQRAEIGASNISLTSGSSADLLKETATLGEADAFRIKTNYGERASALEQQAALTRSEGEAKRKAGSSSFGTSLLIGGGMLAGTAYASKWFKPDSAGLAPSTTNFGLARSPTSSSFGLRAPQF